MLYEVITQWHMFFNSSDRFLEIALGKKDDVLVKDSEFFNVYLQDVK